MKIMRLNLTARTFPLACRGVSERIQMSFAHQIEDSPLLATGSFNVILLFCLISSLLNPIVGMNTVLAQSADYFTIPFLDDLQSIQLDGNLDEYQPYPFLRLTPRTHENYVQGTINDSLDLNADIWILVDNEYFYMAGRITDESLINE